MPSENPSTARVALRPARLFVDSSAWIALRNRRDQYHAEADRLFHEAVRRRIPFITTNLVVAEAHRLTLSRAGVGAARRVLEKIDASPSVTVEFAGADAHARARHWIDHLSPHPITYADAISFAVMEATGCRTAISFDQDFVIAGFILWRPW